METVTYIVFILVALFLLILWMINKGNPIKITEIKRTECKKCKIKIYYNPVYVNKKPELCTNCNIRG